MKTATIIYFCAILIGCSSQKNSDKTLAQASVDTVIPHKGDHQMVTAATAFLNSLPPELKATTAFPFDHEKREEWNFVPMENRMGARIGKLSEEQQQLAFRLLETGLSEQGYKIAREIMALEEILIIKENQEPGSDYRNPTKYFLSVFGTPSPDTPWGWKYEGHHLSLNYSAVAGSLSVTPTFLGANPAEVDIEKEKGKRVLAKWEDQGRALMLSLDPEQQQKALISEEAYREILTGSESYARLEKFEGLSYSDMTPEQRTGLIELIKRHSSIMKSEVAKDQWNRIADHQLDKLFFAWAGSLKKNEKHYYRIHGPTTIIEYDNTQNNGNHAHSAWRDIENDFGRDLLKAHHLEHQH